MTGTPEPHALRRKALLAAHPEVRALMGPDRRTLLVLAGVLVGQFAAAVLLQRWHTRAGTTIPFVLALLAVAYGVGGTLNHLAGCVIHEAAHDLVARTRLANRLAALAANLPILVPAAMPFRRYHLAHHKRLGVPVVDNDLATGWEIRWVGRSPARKIVWLVFYQVAAIFARGFGKSLDRWERVNVAVSIVATTLVTWLLGGTALSYLLLSTFFGYSLLHPAGAHFIHEHYLWEADQETYSYYGPLNHVTLNVGYHVEHHDLMNVACWRLPALHRAAPELYEGLTTHRSWVRLLGHFVVNREIGHDSRWLRHEATAGAAARVRGASRGTRTLAGRVVTPA
jgi:sphingolipid delta-4 desaturase